MADNAEDETCILCDKILLPENIWTIKERAIQSLIDASKLRKDQKHRQLQRCKTIKIHRSCQTTYVRKSSIEASLKESTVTVLKEKRNSTEGRNFDFLSCCFICGGTASSNFVRYPISYVKSKEVRTLMLEELQQRPLDDFNTALYTRISTVEDLCDNEARYHIRCYRKFYHYRPTTSRGRPISETMSAALSYVINYILDNGEECQFSLNDILTKFKAHPDFTGEFPRASRLIENLKDHFEDEIVIHSLHSDSIICYRDAQGKLLNDAWYEKRFRNEDEERVRIVEMAANIILQDIRSGCYDTTNYKAPGSFLDNVSSDIPPTLQVFLDILVKSHKRYGNKELHIKKLNNRVTTFAHILMASVRQRTFLSPIMLGLSSMMHKKYGSKCLVDALSFLGLCASYRETTLFEASIVNDPEHYRLLNDFFLQFIFDNADHNTITLDGYGTFHAMGGVMCVTPFSAVESNEIIKRLNEMPSKEEIGAFGYIDLKHFERGVSIGLNNIIIKDLEIEHPVDNDIKIDYPEFLWSYGKHRKPLNYPGWSGFMEIYHDHRGPEDFSKSKVIPMPFVNAPPSSYDTIFTVLVEAAYKCKSVNQKHCIVTFDQPLYWKAREIVSCIDPSNDVHNLMSVIVRLGGFHALMSYYGAIGFIMEGSGLKEAFCEIFAETSAEKALTGHAFSRAVRGHNLIQQALAELVIQSLNLDEEDVELLDNILNEEISKKGSEEGLENNILSNIKNKFVTQLQNLKENGPTAELWLQYFRMVLIAKRFIAAERSGNWKLHLQCMQLMIPYYYASGHHLYAKSAQLYLQDMLQLESEMDPSEHNKFCNSGFFTIRRSDKFWSGIWSDMTIEQALMRAMKSSGGLTHGRGITNSVVAKWVLSTIVLAEVCNQMETFCNVSYITSEQHVDARVSRISRDAVDLQKVLTFFKAHDPFPETDSIMSIHSGVVGDKKINCHKALEVGRNLQKKNVGEKFGSVKFQRRNKVSSLRAVYSTIPIADETVEINPLLIFQRISLKIQEKDDMKKYLQYELAPYPLSLFDEGGMRKTQKSVFYDNFQRLDEIPETSNVIHVVDGGFLLHRVVWHQNNSIKQILGQYVSYVKKMYSANSSVVFDGYPDEISASGTKFCERSRRKVKNVGREVVFDANTTVTFSQEKFLSNDKNKKRLIAALSEELKKAGFCPKSATEDADLLIVETAVELAREDVTVKIVGQDIDLLVLLTQIAPEQKNILYEKVNCGRVANDLYDVNSFKHGELKNVVTFLHVFTGCDSTSCFFKQGKNKLLKTMRESTHLQALAKRFYDAHADPNEIARNGNEIIAAMYSAKEESAGLAELRFLHFQKSTLKISKTFKLESLPPTEAAAKEHSFRVYHQVQQWLGNAKNATQWGWKLSTSGLVPVLRDEEWEDGPEQSVLESSEQDGETIVKDEEEEEEEEELQRAFSRHSEDYLQDGRLSSVPGPDLENQNSLDSEALGTGSSSWHSEDGRPTSRKGEETPSSCATPTSASFPSEPEVETEIGPTTDGNNPAAPYPCQFCDRMFPRLSYLKKHEQSHGDQMPYRCSWCARLFKHKRSRDRHVKLHTGDRRYRCSHCEAAFSRSDHLKIHMKTHDTQKPFQCTSCSRGYNTAAALTSHMQSHKRHQNSQGSKLEMDFGRRSVSSHSTASPPIPSSPSPSLNLILNHKSSMKSQASASNPIISSPLKLACMYCTRDSFTSMQQLQLHVHTMHQAILSGENLMPSPGQTLELSSHLREQSDRPERTREDYLYEKKFPEERPLEEKDMFEAGLSCGQCTMKFSSSSSLREHLISIHRTDGFGSLMVCPFCRIPCSSAAAYAEHYVLQHCGNRRISGETREYGDPKIDGSYDSKEPRIQDRGKMGKDLNSEPADLTNKHSKPSENYSAGTFLCGQCPAAFKDFESFREHVAGHLKADQRNEVLRNQCPKCEASFQEREDMMVHLTKHFLGQVTKEYACSACKKFFPHPDLLQRHLLDSHAHHLYRCALCRDTFDSRVAIQVHFAVKHSQECRIHRCNVCSGSNNENSPGNAPGENRNFFRSEAEMANHVRTVHAPPSLINESPVPRSPASTPGMTNSSLRCRFCGICCSSDLDLHLHMASHSSSLYRCPICREGFTVEFLLDRHIAQAHHANDHPTPRSHTRENGRIHRPSRSQEDVSSESREQRSKRGRSPASSNNNSLNQRDNNNKRPNFGSGIQQCELCERGEFANEAELQAHKKLAHTPAKVQGKALSAVSNTCAYCGEVCRSRTELESHTRIQHATSEHGGRHKCNICDEVCPSGATLAEHKLQKHCKIQLSDICIVCRGTLHSESHFLEHVQRHSLESVDPQQRLDNSLPHLPAPCVICRQTLISDLECRLHARHHLKSSGGSQSSESPSPNQKSQTHSCCLCLREFNGEEFVNLPSNHSSSGSQILRVCKACYVRHSQGLPILNSPYEHARTSKSELWMKESHWDGSRERWDGERNFKVEERNSDGGGSSDGRRCEECGVKFEDPEDAEKHRIAEHEKPAGTYTCIQCQMSFPTEAKIQQHVKKEHLESSGKGSLEALRCHLCLFDANSPLQLQSHLIEHTFAGCTALSCYICQALFTAPIGLQNHMLQQHGLGARPYDCSYCGLKFFFRAELDHHVAVFHSTGERIPSPKNREIQNEIQDSEQHNEMSDKVIVKKEICQNNEDEDINVNMNDKSEKQEQSSRNLEQTESEEVRNEFDNESE